MRCYFGLLARVALFSDGGEKLMPQSISLTLNIFSRTALIANHIFNKQFAGIFIDPNKTIAKKEIRPLCRGITHYSTILSGYRVVDLTIFRW